ncbi:MAG: hypothetical protein ABIT01_12325, partial [Thermoanaerobaculia bacterium]
MYRSRLGILRFLPLALLLQLTPAVVAQPAEVTPPPPKRAFFGEPADMQAVPDLSMNPVAEFGDLGKSPTSGARNALACPTGTIPNFIANATCTGSCAIALTWSAPTGADGNTVYEIYRSLRSDYCNTVTPSLLATVQGLSYGTSVPVNAVQSYYLAVQGCGTITTPFNYIYDTYQT